LLLTLQGYAQQRIIGGNEISITERPFQVHIEKKDIEKELQHKIAYCKRKDIPVLMYHRVIETEEEKPSEDESTAGEGEDMPKQTEEEQQEEE
jgi:hypothetical protein